MSAEEWSKTPWWEQNILREGLEMEAPWIGRVAMTEKAEDTLNIQLGAFGNPFEEDLDDGSADLLASDGIQVRRSDKMTPVYQSADNR